MSVSITLVGEFLANVDGRSIKSDDFERRSAVELVALLALSERQRLPREQVIDALWPDLLLDAGGNQLNKASTYARSALGHKGAIVLRSGVVSLFPAATIEVDYQRFLNVDVADVSAVDDVLVAHPGPLLPDWPYADWTIEPRRVIHRFRLDLLRQRSRWEEILNLEPLDEGAHMALMATALERGNRDEVVRRFEVLEQLLESELGVGPSVAAQAIRDEALAGENVGESVVVSGLRSFLTIGLDLTSESDDGIVLGDRTADGIIADLGGVVYRRTDEQLWATFASASDAISAAIECQRTVQAEVSIRVALDLGEAEHRDGDWSGPVLTRLDGMAEASWGGQIVCSSAIAEMAALHDRSDLRSIDIGLYRLPGIAPVRLHRLVTDDIENRQTPLRALRAGGKQQEVAPGQLFGREEEVGELLDHLSTERMVTIVGPGGTGKTHLARHLAAQLHPTMAGGAWMCELAPLSEGAAVGQVILSSLGGHVHSDASVIESVARIIGESEVLLVVDNCEHLSEVVSAVCEELLLLTPNLRLLATSRQPLGVATERVFGLGQLTRPAAIQLFSAEAGRQGAEVDSEAAAIDRICERLDDLPLALQLAAARTGSLDLDAIESLLEDRFAYLATQDRAGPAHHQTLHAAISWSFDALPPEARQVLGALSIFAGRFSLQAATAICAEPGQEDRFVQRLDELVRRSLVVRPDRNGNYRLLTSIKIFAKQTEEIGEDIVVRHITFFAARAQQSANLIRSDLRSATSRFSADWDDLRQALASADELKRPADVHRLLAGCTNFSILTQEAELLEWCEAFLDPADKAQPGRAVESRDHGDALLGWAYWLAVRGDSDGATVMADAVHRALPDGAGARWVRGFADYSAGADGHGRQWFTAAGEVTDPTEVIAQVGGLVQLAVLDAIAGNDISDLLQRLEIAAIGGGTYQRASYLLAGAMHMAMSDPVAALATFEECISLAESSDLLVISATARSARAFTMLLSRPLSEAYEGLRSTLEWSADRGMWSWTIADFPTAAGALELGGQPRIATLLLSARSTTRFDVGIGSELVDLQIEGLRTAHPDDFDNWWQQGQQLSPTDAARLAISNLGR